MLLREYLAQQQQLVDARTRPPGSRRKTRRPRPFTAPCATACSPAASASGPFFAWKRRAPVADASTEPVAAACSLELIHTYSLIHDDLPALDNDDYRRGKLTNHKVFGDAMAILAGDALLTLAFQVLAQLRCAGRSRKARMIAELATASGTVGGMIGGQVADLEGEGKTPDAQLLETIHRAKTGALLRASLRMGAIYAGANDAAIRRALLLRRAYRPGVSDRGRHSGRGRIVRSARQNGRQRRAAAKITFPAVYGLEASRRMAAEECERAHQTLEPFGGRAARLHELADMIVQRKS